MGAAGDGRIVKYSPPGLVTFGPDFLDLGTWFNLTTGKG